MKDSCLVCNSQCKNENMCQSCKNDFVRTILALGDSTVPREWISKNEQIQKLAKSTIEETDILECIGL